MKWSVYLARLVQKIPSSLLVAKAAKLELAVGTIEELRPRMSAGLFPTG